MKYSAEEIIEKLDMEPHYEGGWYKFVWKCDKGIPEDCLPAEYQGSRSTASVIYYLLKPGETSCWHKLRSDEMWFWQYGGTLEMTLGGETANPVEHEKIRIGSDIGNGEAFNSLVKAGHWQTTTPVGDEFVLVSCVVTPGFENDDFMLPRNEEGTDVK
jgi:hypothetical protein